MPIIRLKTEIAAPREIVFDLSRSIDLQAEATGHISDRTSNGRMANLLAPGETVTWETRLFGIRQRLTSEITAYDRPRSFRDSMVHGPFERFDHDLVFEEKDESTILTDIFDYTSPLGPLGRLADSLFVTRYVSNLLRARNALLRAVAESGDSSRFLTTRV